MKKRSKSLKKVLRFLFYIFRVLLYFSFEVLMIPFAIFFCFYILFLKEEKSKKSIDKFFDFICNIEEKLEEKLKP